MTTESSTSSSHAQEVTPSREQADLLEAALVAPVKKWNYKEHTAHLKSMNTVLLTPTVYTTEKRLDKATVSMKLRELCGQFPSHVRPEGRTWTASFHTDLRAKKVTESKLITIGTQTFRTSLYGVFKSEMLVRVEDAPQWVTRRMIIDRFQGHATNAVPIPVAVHSAEAKEQRPLSGSWMVTVNIICRVPKFIDFEGYKCRSSDINACWTCRNRGHAQYKCPQMPKAATSTPATAPLI
jgi:hypothetical protein